MSTTLRVDEGTRDRVNRLREQTQQSADGVLRHALDAYEDALYWQQWRTAYHAQTPEQAAAYAVEQADWDSAGDGDARP